MTYLELVAAVAQRAELDEKAVHAALDALSEVVVEQVAGDGKALVAGLGTFKPALKRRNPRATKDAPRGRKLVLTPSSTVNARLNG